MNPRSTQMLLLGILLVLFALTHFAETVVTMLILGPLNLPPDSSDAIDGLVALVGVVIGVRGFLQREQATS